MKRWIAVLALACAGCLLDTGCNLHGNGGFGFKQSTSWTFFHETEKADDTQVAKSEVNIPGLWDWLFPKKQPPQPEATAAVSVEAEVKTP